MKNTFEVGDVVIFPSFKPVNNKYYYAIIFDVIEHARDKHKTYKCLMDGEIIVLTKGTIKKAWI